MADDLRLAPTRLITLVQRSLRTEDDVIAEHHGSSWQIRRDPHPGVTIELTEIRDGKPEGATVRAFSAQSQRHPAYPPDMPFIADLPVFVRQDSEAILVAWMRGRRETPWPPSDLPDEMLWEHESPFMKSLSERIQPIADRVRAGDREARGDFMRVMGELRAEHGEEFAQLQTVMQSAFQGPEAIAAFTKRFDGVVEESVGAGWQEGAPWESPTPFPERGVRLERGGRVREIRGTVFGPAQWIALYEAAA